MKAKAIRSSKNPSAKKSIDANGRTVIIGFENCIADFETGECIELPPCKSGNYDPITGECIPNITIDPCADCDGLCNQDTGECFDITDPPGPVSSGYAGTTPGNFSVTLSGAASYVVPLSMPPGIKDIAPNLGIAYSSQASNGLAGWGWSLSGVSTISRIQSSDFHDGQIDGIDFDNSDRLALDGQRLIAVNGGTSATEYKTENYSNLRILGYGTSPYGSSYGHSYYIVSYPDGTRAYYGNGGNSRGRLEWSLYKKVDPQGNYIQYEYLKSNELLRINKIKYGASGSAASPNEIQFYYKTRTRPEVSYIGNYTFKRTNILDRVEIRASGQLFRKYVLSHNTTSLGYQRLSSIREYNTSNESFPPIYFTYESSSSGIVRDGEVLDIYPGINYNSDGIAVGEFDADGKMDFITYNKSSRNELNIFLDVFNDFGTGFNLGYTVPTEKFDDVFASTILSHNGHLLPQQAITTVRETTNSSNSNVRFRTFAKAPSGFYLQYDKNVTFPIGPAGSFQCDAPSNNDYRIIPKTYVSGDFNGDGLTDVLAIPRKYYRKICEYEYDPWDNYEECICSNQTISQGNSEVYFIDLKRDTPDAVTNIGSLANRIVTNNTDKLYAIDFDGDGKTDLMHVRNDIARVYSLNISNQLVEIAVISNGHIDVDKPLLIGDYNGDGKTDFTQPSSNNSSTWRFYLSKGNSFYYYSKNINVTYTENYVHNGGRTVNGVYMLDPLYEYHYIAQDYNGDGKSDILKHEVVSPYSSYNVVSDRLMLYENKHNSGENTPWFHLTTNSLAVNNGITKFGIPLFLEANASNSNLEYAYIDGNNVHTYQFNRDHKRDTELKRIYNNGVTTDILYERLDSEYGSSVYSHNFDEQYPYVNINLVPSFKIVQEVTHTGSGHEQRELFRYEGAVSHVGGLGFLGFKTFKKTNTFGTGVGQLWNVSKHDPHKRGAVTQQWVSTSPSGYPSSNFANRTTYTYSTELLSNKVYINIPTQIDKEDGLQGFSSTESYTYDSYKSPLTISTTYPNGSNTVTYQYSNNPSSTGSTYHIGRPTKKIETNVIGGESFTTEVQYTYNNNLATQAKNRANGTPWVTENLTYDAFGNVTQKTLSATGVASRTELFEYDSSGRYLTKSTDLEGLETSYTYNVFGNPTTSTNHYGHVTTFEYDGWQRPSKTTNYLGKETNTYYNNEVIPGIGNCFTKLVDADGGKDTKTYYNSLGWVVQTKTLALNNQWVQKSFEHDVTGKTTRESEPYFSTASATQWNTFSFDQYARPISTQLFTGKIINTTYNGLSATVDDGTKTVTTTKDAVGNILTLQDPGGTVSYQYYGNGAMKSASYGSHTVSATIDGWGRKASLNDPTAGTYTYDYNILGEIVEEATPKGTTTYQYDDFGKLIFQEIVGDNTAMTVDYNYDNTTSLLNSINGSDEINGKSFGYVYEYDSNHRLVKTTETSTDIRHVKEATYDGFGRIDSETFNSRSLISNVTSIVKVKYIFDDSGLLVEMKDFNTNNLLWKTDDIDERGQLLNIELGNGIIKTKQYDAYGFLENITEKTEGIGSVQALKLDYSFDIERGILNSRKNYGFTNWDEGFTHDNLDRLTQISGAISHTKTYDNEGRITNNSFVGDYNYDSSNMYRLRSIDLNNQGDIYYQQHQLQQITYNAFKKPVEIYEEGKGRVNFEYGPLMNRTAAFYGGLQEDKTQRQYQKFYSSISPVEMIEDTASGNTKIITYIGGDAYSAPIAYVKREGSGNSIDEYHYLHRDYLGSILAISNSSTEVVEQRQFGAWGETDAFKRGNTIAEFNHDSLIGRGFTGHEHFFEVSLLHMNGRMYDAHLGRFLSPDNYIQDPYNTQSFNRYGYVWNNPLSFNDPSGEIFWAIVGVAALIGAVTGAATYVINAIITGNWSWGGFAMSVLGGAVAGALAGIVAPGAFAGLFTNATAFFWGSVATGVAASFLPAVTIPIGDFSFSISPAIAFGNGAISAGANFSLSYSDGNFNASIGFGITYASKSHGSNAIGWEFRKSWAINWDDGKTSFGFYSTKFSGHNGEFNQKVGGLQFRSGDFRLRYENDGGAPFKWFGNLVAGNTDQHRTTALFLAVKELELNVKFFTGIPDEHNIDKSSSDAVYGVYNNSEADQFRLSSITIGFFGYQAGFHNEDFRMLGQNKLIHDNVTHEPGFRGLHDRFPNKFLFQYQSYNPYTLW
ncbi:MAG: polymorphic toxin type 23 domain-containing protein [Bacteroidota bacterium]